MVDLARLQAGLAALQSMSPPRAARAAATINRAARILAPLPPAPRRALARLDVLPLGVTHGGS